MTAVSPEINGANAECLERKASMNNSERSNVEWREGEQRTLRLANLFLALALVFGLLLIFLEPPFVCPDENAHYLNICHLSHGHLFAAVEGEQFGVYLTPEEFDLLSVHAGDYHLREKNLTYNLETALEFANRPVSEELMFAETKYATINPLPYLVPAAFVGLLRLLGFGLNGYATIVLGKVANLLLYALLIRHAIKKTGALRHTMFLLALMPMAIFQGASLSYDALLIAGSFVLFAYATKILTAEEHERITGEDIVWISASAAALIGCKIAYAPLVLLLLAIPVKKFGTTKRYFACVGTVVGVMAAVWLVPTAVNGVLTRGLQPAASELMQQQQAYFNENPAHLFTVIVATVKHFGAYWAESFFGILGWLDTQFPMPFVLLFFLVLFFSFVTEAGSMQGIRWLARILSFLSVVIFFVGTLYTMYVKWNPELVGIVGGDIAYGGQGRYFIPPMLFFLFSFSCPLLQKFRIRGGAERLRERVVTLTATGYLCLTVLVLLARYWI